MANENLSPTDDAPTTSAGSTADTSQSQSSGSSESADSSAGAKASGAAQALRDGATQLTKQATDRARGVVDEGKTRATTALDDFSRMIADAATTVDEKVGEQYGEYARSAAGQLSGLAETIRNKDVDDMIAEARDYVKKSPGVAISAAAAIGFVIARMVKSGLEADNASASASADNKTNNSNKTDQT